MYRKNAKLLLICFLSLISFSAAAIQSKTIARENFKGNWPFNADVVELRCIGGNPYVMNLDDKELYALTGMAQIEGKAFGALRLDNNNPFWLDGYGNGKKSLSDVIEAAFELCDK